MSEQTEALAKVCKQIEIAADTVGRSAGDIELIAVSKTFGADAIEPVIEAGQRVFGENRVQESLGKWPGLKAKYPDIKLHLIGPLQTNKVRDAVGLYDCIQTLDRPKLARALAKEMEHQGRSPDLFVQVNTGEETQKAGVLPDDTDEFVRFCREDCGLKLLGLMCIPPFDEEPSLHFALLAKIAERNGLSALS
ncbi:MAG: YggS family pyridoxal phosphate-dependent enzyme, partial [Rhizobiales bacterium]|nr:YggS family pyridoxal phosphate-dependent enzyme [Hyphomicrobiales bacterium]